MADRKTQDTTGIPEWQQVDSNDVIDRLRKRVSDLEWALDLSELRNHNLLRLLKEKNHAAD